MRIWNTFHNNYNVFIIGKQKLHLLHKYIMTILIGNYICSIFKYSTILQNHNLNQSTISSCCGWLGKTFINSFTSTFSIDLNEFSYSSIEMPTLVFLSRDLKVDGEDFRKASLLTFPHFINNPNPSFSSSSNSSLNTIISIT